MKCLNCGSENQEDNKFCQSCGKALEENIANQQSFEENNELNNSTHNLDPVQPVQQPVFQPVYNNQQNKSNKGLIIGLSIGGGVLLLIIIVVIMFFLFFKSNIKKSDWEWNFEEDIIDIEENKVNNNTLDEETVSKKEKVSDYKPADPVTLVDGSKWHVIGTNGDKLILLSDELAKEESGYGKSASAEDQKYENSIIKEYLEDTYLPDLKESLKSAGGDTDIKVRLITMDEVIDNTGSEFYDEKCYSDAFNDAGNFYTINSDGYFENYSEIVTGKDAFADMLSLTKRFWTMSNTTQRKDCESDYVTYYGAYYVEIDDDDVGNYGYIILSTDMDGSASSSTGEHLGGGTSAGIRPVIETSIKNIK